MKARLGPEHPFYISPKDALRHPAASITKARARKQALQTSAIILNTIQQRATLILSQREGQLETKPLHEALRITPTQADAFRALLPAMYARELIVHGNRRDIYRERKDTKTSLRVRRKQRHLISQTREYVAVNFTAEDIQKAEALAQRFARGAVIADVVSFGDKTTIRRKVSSTVDTILRESRPVSSRQRRTK